LRIVGTSTLKSSAPQASWRSYLKVFVPEHTIVILPASVLKHYSKCTGILQLKCNRTLQQLYAAGGLAFRFLKADPGNWSVSGGRRLVGMGSV